MVKEIQIPKEDGESEAKDVDGKEVYDKIKLHKTETNPIDKLIMEEEPTASGESDEDRGTDQGEGDRSPCLVTVGRNWLSGGG